MVGQFVAARMNPIAIMASMMRQAPHAAMRPGYKRILAYQRSCVGGGQPPFRYFRVSSAHLSAERVGDRRDGA